MYFIILLILVCSVISNNKVNGQNSLPSLSDSVDRHAIFAQPLTQGVYSFDGDGYIPKLPLERVRKIHKEMIKSIQAIDDHKKQIQYLLTLSNTANNDLDKLRQKIEQLGRITSTQFDKTDLKADGFVLLVSHAALMSNAILYFPDTMKVMLQKNPAFESNIKWVVEFAVKAKIINDQNMLKLFNLAQQELGIIPKDKDYRNPYKYENHIHGDAPSSTTTKKPRKRLQRGPRMSGGEL